MIAQFKAKKDGAIEREEAFRDQCAIYAMQALLSRPPEEYENENIEQEAFFYADMMSIERRIYSTDWGWIEPEEESTTD
jgi:hypothetical protein